MATVLRIDPSTLPRLLILDPPISDEEFEALCHENRDVRMERTKEGAVHVNPPTGGWTGSGNSEITFQLTKWWSQHERGRVFDSSTGFRLPDGSTLSPDASFLSQERLRGLPKGGLRGFPRVCPDFVIELMSETDSLSDLQAKMNDWIVNGAQLGWLIDPFKRQVFVYRPGQPEEQHSGNLIAAQRPLDDFVLDLARVWKCYED